MFQTIERERRARYAAAGLIPLIRRPRQDLFLGDFQRRWAPNGNVTFLTPFQSGEDLRNDVQALFIKPLTCYFLSWYHSGAWLYELGLTLIHLVTLDFDNAGDHAFKCLTSIVSIFVYDFLFYAELISNALSLTMRTLMTIGSGVYQAGVYLAGGAPNEEDDLGAELDDEYGNAAVL